MPDDIVFIPAVNFTPANRDQIDLIVIHTMEVAEGPTSAENVAKSWAKPNSPKASAHYCVDTDSTVRCVLDKNVAWHAPGANRNGIGIEHAGFAGQSASDWGDAASQSILARSAKLVADLCRRYAIPVERVDVAGLLANPQKRGLTGHVDVSQAFKKSDHWDPGPNFPWERYLAMVKKRAVSAVLPVT